MVVFSTVSRQVSVASFFKDAVISAFSLLTSGLEGSVVRIVSRCVMSWRTVEESPGLKFLTCPVGIVFLDTLSIISWNFFVSAEAFCDGVMLEKSVSVSAVKACQFASLKLV